MIIDSDKGERERFQKKKIQNKSDDEKSSSWMNALMEECKGGGRDVPPPRIINIEEELDWQFPNLDFFYGFFFCLNFFFVLFFFLLCVEKKRNFRQFPNGNNYERGVGITG